MWFRTKSNNRRLGRKHVLDVKLRSSQLRAIRMRFSAIALAVSFGTVFGLYLLWRAGNWALNRFLYQNRTFAIQQVEVRTDGSIPADQLRRWAGVKPGDNLLALDLTSVRRHLELISAIQSVAIERVLPRTLRIRVAEREPLAQVYVSRPRPGGGCDLAPVFLDAQGCVILPLDSPKRSATSGRIEPPLPAISGIPAGELRPGKRVELPQVRAALELIEAFERSPMAALVDLKWIDISSPEILQVATVQSGEITFSTYELNRQLLRWREIHDFGQGRRKVIATLDLAVTDNSPVRWFDAREVAPAAPKPAKPLPARKKNV